MSSLHKFAEFGKSIMSLHPSFVLKLVLLVLRKKKKREKERNHMPNGIREWEKKASIGFLNGRIHALPHPVSKKRKLS